MLPRKLFAVLVALTLQGSTITVASMQSVSGTGQTLSAEEQAAQQKTLRENRTKGFRDAVIAFQKKEDAYRKAQKTYLQKISDFRTACRADLRRANRDTKFKVVLRCERGELSLQKEFMRKERDVVAQTPGIAENIRTNAGARLTSLIDAVTLVIEAIDSGVFTAQGNLAEARSNLLRKFRIPAWESLTLARADRLLTAVMLLLRDLEANPEQTTSTGSGAIATISPQTCLEEDESKLIALLLPEATNRKEQLRSIHAHLHTCITLIP